MKLGDKLREAMKLPCADKRRYDTYEDARQVAIQRTKPEAKDRAKFLQPYGCEHGCGGFHITSRPFRDRIKEFPVIGDWTE